MGICCINIDGIFCPFPCSVFSFADAVSRFLRPDDDASLHCSTSKELTLHLHSTHSGSVPAQPFLMFSQITDWFRIKVDYRSKRAWNGQLKRLNSVGVGEPLGNAIFCQKKLNFTYLSRTCQLKNNLKIFQTSTSAFCIEYWHLVVKCCCKIQLSLLGLAFFLLSLSLTFYF